MIAGIIGAAGYAGAELIRLLSGHPEIKSLVLGSVSLEGEQIENVFPNFQGIVSGALLKPEDLIARSDLVFAALPHGVGEKYAKACIEKGSHYIDLSADFRFDKDEETYKSWYAKGFEYPELRERSVYGLPELNRGKILEKKSQGPMIIANPGCYPTSAALGAFPALVKGIFSAGTIIVDAASGITGGGREPQKSFHFPECSGSMTPYKVGEHRHTPEIARTFFAMLDSAAHTGGSYPGLIFTPHLAPMNRGILSTIYIPLASRYTALGTAHAAVGRADGEPGTADQAAGVPRQPAKEIKSRISQIREIYTDFYKDEPFVRVLPAGVFAATNRVSQSNYCDISVHMDQGGTTLIIISAIDNMVKGASGQAIQNMNILCGFDETAGLKAIPALF